MSKIILGIFSLFMIVSCGEPQAQSTKKVSFIKGSVTNTLAVNDLPIDGLVTPESVSFHKGVIYVSSIGGNPMESPKKGFFTLREKNQTTYLFEGLLDDPKGFAFLDDDTIIVSDHPTVKILKISTGAVVATLPIDAPGFMNDLVAIDANTFLVSDTGKGLLYKVLVNNEKTSLSYTPVTGITENGINGLIYDAPSLTLYFVTSTFGGDATRGHIFEAKLNEDFSAVTSLVKWDTPQIGAGGLDGLDLMLAKNKTYLVVSDWGTGAENGAKIFGYDLATKTLSFTIEGDITAVADIDINKKNVLFMPEFTQNRITTINLSKAL